MITLIRDVGRSGGGGRASNYVGRTIFPLSLKYLGLTDMGGGTLLKMKKKVFDRTSDIVLGSHYSLPNISFISILNMHHILNVQSEISKETMQLK